MSTETATIEPTTTTTSEFTTPTPSTGIEPGSILATGDVAPPAMPQAPVEKPEYVPDKFWRDGKVDTEAMAKSYSGLEQLLGKKASAVVVPNEKSTPEEVAAFRKAIGVPETPDAYVEKIKPEALPEGIHFDENLAKVASEIAHKYNVPPAALRELTNLQIAQVQAMQQMATQEAIKELETGKQELAKVYGDQLPAKLELAKRAAATVGVNPSSRGFTDPDVVKGFITLAEKLSEDKLVSAESAGMGGGERAAKDIQTNPENPYYERYQNGDPEIVDLVRRYRMQG